MIVVDPRGALQLIVEMKVNINEHASDGSTLLYLAASMGDDEIVRILLKDGADPSARCIGGFTALHAAAESGTAETAMELIANGANINAKDQSGVTPLHAAAGRIFDQEEGNLIIAILIRDGAVVNAKDSDGQTPLDYAEGGGEELVAQFLRRHGAKSGKDVP
jgi:cytohesin